MVSKEKKEQCCMIPIYGGEEGSWFALSGIDFEDLCLLLTYWVSLEATAFGLI
jgi:hypothetical protein